VVVGWAAEIVVDHRRRGPQGRSGEGELVKAVFEDRGDAAAGGGVKRKGALTGGFEPPGAIAFDEVEETQTTAVALLGMGPVLQEMLNQGTGVRTDGQRPVEETPGRPFHVLAMRFGHVIRERGEAAFAGAAPVTGHPFPFVQYLHGSGSQAHVDRLADQAVGDAVEMAVDFDMIIEVDAGFAPLGLLVGLGRQGGERGLVVGQELGVTRARELFEEAVVEFRQQRANSGIELVETKEGVGAQPGEDPAFDQLDPGLDLGLVPGFVGARRQHGRAVMRGQVSIGGVEVGFVATGFGNPRFEIVGYDELRHPAKEGEGADMRANLYKSILDLTKCDFYLRCQVDKSVRSATRLITSPLPKELYPRRCALGFGQSTSGLGGPVLHYSSGATHPSRLVTPSAWYRSSCET
jgi:hypothetical protein